MDYMPESTAITLFNYPKDSARRNCFQWRTLLPSPPSKPNPSSTYEICVLCRPRSLLNSHLPFPWLRHLSTTAFGGSISPLPLPSSQPTYHQIQAGRETSLQNHLFIPGLLDVVQHQSGKEILTPHRLLSFPGLFGETAADIS